MSGGGRIPRAFFDTNILVYADDPKNPAKQRKALELIKEHRSKRTGAVSLQVLQEYFVTVTRKYGVDPAIARDKVEIFAKFQVAEPIVSDILAAVDFHRLHGVSYWDALILRSAKQSGCSVLLTEDMQHGQMIDGVRIVNPFL
jgi:predicted nucleic acid-binding protein